MSHRPGWPGLALLVGPWLAACQDPAETEVETASGSPHRIPDRYELIDLGTPTGSIDSTPTALNNRSEVTGTSGWAEDPILFGFYWNEDDGLTDLGAPPNYSWVKPDDINDRGLVVGTVESSTQPTRGFIWDDGQFELIEPPPGGSFTEAWGVNRAGDIVGATDFTAGVPQAYLRQEGEFTALGLAEGGTWSRATAINRNGDIIGTGDNGAGTVVGLLWEDEGERMIDLSTVLSVPDFLPNAISRGGELAGFSESLGHAVFVEVGGQTTDLGSLEGAAGYSVALGINRQAQVVGLSSTPEFLPHAFVWEDGEMVDLNDRIDPGAGVVLTGAVAINDRGEIAASGRTEGAFHAYLLRPE